ncbi:MAG: polysaccharide biosynthesis C-terminal domain-containing protein [Ignavibacteria bacterium]
MNFSSISKIFKENQYILFGQIIDKIFYFIFFAILARTLNLQYYGSIVIVFTFANLIVVLFSFGFPIYLQREAAFNVMNSGILFTKLISFNLFLSVPYLAFSFVVFRFLYPDFEVQLLLILIIITAISSNENLLLSLLRGLKRFKTIFYILFFSRAITMSFIVLVWIGNYNNGYIIPIFLFGNLLYLTVIVYASRHNFKSEHLFKLKFNDFTGLIVVTFPVWFAMLFNFLYDKIDVFIISKIINFEQLSFYSIAYGVLKSSTVAFNFLLIGGLSKVVLFTDSKKGLRVFLFKYSELLIIISVLIFILLFFGAKEILVLLYTDKFINSVVVLQVLSFAIIPLSLNNLTGVVLNGVGLYKENMYVTILGFLFNLVANIIIIPIYGIIGAAYITILTEILILSGDLYFLKLKNKI